VVQGKRGLVCLVAVPAPGWLRFCSFVVLGAAGFGRRLYCVCHVGKEETATRFPAPSEPPQQGSLLTTMSALSFSAAVAVRPVAAGNVVRARSTARTANTTKALGGFGVNMPKEEYQQKMEAKSRLIAANKAKAAAGKPQGGGFSGFSFGACIDYTP
jgi:hypothetical protein